MGCVDLEIDAEKVDFSIIKMQIDDKPRISRFYHVGEDREEASRCYIPNPDGKWNR